MAPGWDAETCEPPLTGRRHHTLSVLVENKPGVLARVSSLISRRGFNIESLAVGPTEYPHMSRMTLVVTVEDHVLEQLTKQLNKLIEVLKIVELEPRRGPPRADLGQGPGRAGAARPGAGDHPAVRRQGGRRPADTITIEATGSPEKLDAMLKLLEPFGLRELVQSGLVAVGRGSRSITDRSAANGSRQADAGGLRPGRRAPLG